LRLVQRVGAGFRKTTSREHLYLYLKDVDALRGLSEIRHAARLFKALESTYISELIREVRIRVKAPQRRRIVDVPRTEAKASNSF